MVKSRLNRFLLIIILIGLLGTLQWELWFAQGGWLDVNRLKAVKAARAEKNIHLAQRNAALMANIQDLKQGQDAVEETARTDLGMIKPDEQYYQIIDRHQ